jgi:hypothetical protein
VAAVTGFVPLLGVAVARRHALRPALRLERSRLEASGIRTRPDEHVGAMLALYLLVAHVAGLSRLLGARQGRRLARKGAGPAYGDTGSG